MYKITIDGFNGTGKTTLARNLAENLDFTYVSMGMIFRCVAYEMISNDISISDIESVQQILENINIQLPNNNQKNVFIDEVCVTDIIKEMKYAEMSSKISNNLILQNGVRNIIRRYAENDNIIVDGRDTGRLLFPNADVKFALYADIHTRAKRRGIKLGRLPNSDCADIEKTMIEIDNKLILSNCIPPEDAIKIDTTQLNKDEVNCVCLDFIKSKLFNCDKIMDENSL